MNINTQAQQTLPFMVSTTQLILQDEFLNLDDLTELNDASVFRLDSMPVRSYEKDYDTVTDITFEMNVNQKVIARSGYTVLDFLGDVGGLNGLLTSTVALFFSFWHFNRFDNFMVQRLYRAKPKSADSKALPLTTLSCTCQNQREFLRSLLGCLGWKADRHARIFEIGRAKLSRETDIVRII